MGRGIGLLAAIVLGVVLAGQVMAGAWMRTAGDTFLSFGADIDSNGTVATVFAERGIAPRLMLGLDAWHSPFGDWSVLAVATYPLIVEGPAKLSVSLGVGVAESGGLQGPQTRLAVHLGRGANWGWLAADLMVTHRFADDQASAKATATWGRNLSERCAAIVEVRGETRVPISVAPSVACRIGDRVRLRVGGAQAITGSGGAPILSVQTWIEF